MTLPVSSVIAQAACARLRGRAAQRQGLAQVAAAGALLDRTFDAAGVVAWARFPASQLAASATAARTFLSTLT